MAEKYWSRHITILWTVVMTLVVGLFSLGVAYDRLVETDRLLMVRQNEVLRRLGNVEAWMMRHQEREGR